RRARFALEGLGWGALVAFGAGAATIVFFRARGETPPHAAPSATMALVALLSAAASAPRKLRPLRTAEAVDEHHGLQSSRSTAVELGGRPLRTAFEQLAVEVAEARAAAIDPLAPFPFETPRATRAALALAALFALTLLIPPRAHVA